MDNRAEAKKNFEALAANSYPGRGLIVGLDESGTKLLQVYWIMGRSPNSQNRIFSSEGGKLWAEAADESKVEDPSLIIYNAMREVDGLYVATNGDQTDTVADANEPWRALNTRQYEPDAPNFTPRISCIASLAPDGPVAELSILKKSSLGDGCDRQYFRYEQFEKGLGYFISTYEGDGNPLPSFAGEPRLMPLEGGLQAVADATWAHLDEGNRVSLAVKSIDLESGNSEIVIVNRFEKV